MNLDDQICYCYHVSLRKLVNFARREHPVRASQMSNCLGAGTGCGWCIPILVKIYEKAQTGEVHDPSQPSKDAAVGDSPATADQLKIEGLPDSPEEYAQQRKGYLRSDEKNAF